MKLRELQFVNSDATPKTETLHVSSASIERIMAWYGSYYAGDQYAVFVDGLHVEKDQNGELVGEIAE